MQVKPICHFQGGIFFRLGYSKNEMLIDKEEGEKNYD